MKNKKIIIIGAGGHSKSLINLIISTNKFKIIGLIDNQVGNKKVLNYPILGSDKDLIKYYKKGVRYCAIGIGQIKSPYIRIKLFNILKKNGFKIPTIISKTSNYFKDSEIGEGTQIFHNTFINSNVKIGNNCIINSGSIIEHDVEISNNCHISTGAIINGGVKIGTDTFIGSGSIIKNDIQIGKGCTIGMGMIIKKKIENGKILK